MDSKEPPVNAVAVNRVTRESDIEPERPHCDSAGDPEILQHVWRNIGLVQ
jgi:hypothetical protein